MHQKVNVHTVLFSVPIVMVNSGSQDDSDSSQDQKHRHKDSGYSCNHL